MRFFLVLLAFIILAKLSFGQTCIPTNALITSGTFIPISSSLPCIDRGIPYSSTIYFRNFPRSGFTVNSIRIDSITNLPSGINWNTDRQPPIYEADSFGCIDITGTTSDAPGEYLLGIWMTFDPNSPQSSASINVNHGSNSFGTCLRYIFRVKEPASSCPVLTDTACSGHPSTLDKGFILGEVFYDINGNGVKDGNDKGMANQVVDINPVNATVISYFNGSYGIALDAGGYSVEMKSSNIWNVSSSPTTYNAVISNTDTIIRNFDFGLIPIDSIDDVRISITGSPARPGFTTTHWIDYENVGTLVSNGVVSYTYDSIYTSAIPDIAPDSSNGRTMYWNYSNLFPGEHRRIKVILQIPPDVNLLGDTLVSTVTIDVNEGDANFVDNSDVLEQEVIGSYDPNDKAVTPNHPDGVRPESRLTYLIRFQNTGTDTAFTVVIRDTLDSDLNVETLTMLGASHTYSMSIEDDKYVTWTFDNILLPDSNVNEPLSHGFVKYSIKMNDNIPHGTEVTNLAGIYFDFNPPVITNTTKSEVNFFLGISSPESLISSYIYPNPTDGRATIVLGQFVDEFEVELYDYTGRRVVNSEKQMGAKYIIQDQNLAEGVYIYRIISQGVLLTSGKLVVMQ